MKRTTDDPWSSLDGLVPGPDGKLMTRRALLGGAAASLGLFLVGCGGSSDSDDEGAGTETDDSPGTTEAAGEEDTPPTAAPAAGGAEGFTTATLIGAIGSGPGSLDPQAVGGTGGGNWPNFSVHFGNFPVIVDQQARPEIIYLPALAAEVPTVSDDNLVWTIKLRDGLTWHDGGAYTAEDVKFSLDRQVGKADYNPDFEGGYSAQYKDIVDEVTVVDPLTVEVRLSQPDTIFLDRMARTFYQVPKANLEDLGDEGFAAAPVGLGPFKFVSEDKDAELVSERFDDFFPPFGSPEAEATGWHPSHVQNLVQKVIPDDQARIAALQAGEVNLVSNIASDIGAQMAAGDEFTVQYLSNDQPIMIDMNTAMETDPTNGEFNPFRDKRVREALIHSVDIDAIINNVVTGFESYAYGSSTAGFGFPASLPDQRYQYDPDRSRELLAEAGYPDGFETSLVGPIGRWPNSRAVMEAVAGFFAEVGIQANISEAQYQEVVEKVQAKTAGPLIFWARAGGDDPGANFRWNYHSGANFTNGDPIDERADGSQGGGDITAEIDSLVEASEVEFDREQRKLILEEIIEKFYLSAKSLYLYQPVTIVAHTKDFTWDPYSAVTATPEYWNIQPIE